MISLSSGKCVDLSSLSSAPDWTDLIMVDLLIVGSEDGMIRIFVQPKEFCTSTMKALNVNFQQEVYNKVSCLKNPDVLREQLKGFSDISKIAEVRGKKEGEIRIFRSGDTGKAYSWQKGKWNFVGDMISGPEDSANNTGSEIFGGKKYYEGDKFFPEGNYDFIFDIEDHNSIMRQLPFNLGDNTLVSSEKFLAREKWPIHHKEQVMQFLNKNTRPRNNKNSNSVNRPSTTNNNNFDELKPVARAKGLREQMQNFPVYNVETFYRKVNSEGMLKKIKEINDVIVDEEFIFKMTDYEYDLLVGLVNELKELHPTRDLTDREMIILQKKLMNFKGIDSMPVIDLLRLFVLHHSSIAKFNTLSSGNVFIMFCIQNYASIKSDPKMGNRFLLTILKMLANMFKCNPIGFVNCETVLQTFLSGIFNILSINGLKIVLNIIHNFSMYLALNDKKFLKVSWVFDLLAVLTDIYKGPQLVILVEILGNMVYLNDSNRDLVRASESLMNAIKAAQTEPSVNQAHLKDLTNAIGI